MSIVSSLLATLTLALAPADTPDLIVLQDGKEIECRVLYEDDETVVYTRKRKAQEVARAEVASVLSIERSLREYLDRFSAITAGDAAGLLDLADFCESRELHGEARHLRIRVLTIDPTNERAWTALGGVYTERRGWRIRVRGRFLSLADLRERVSDWKNAMEIPTAHFLIRTDGSPERALDIAVDVERAYLAFYDLLGGALRLYPFDEIPELNIYSSAGDYPVPPTPNDIAWFAPLVNILYVNGETATEAPHAAVGELSNLLLWNAMRRTVGRTGSMPPWVRSGISQVFSAAYRRDPGRSSWDFSRPITADFEIHANAEEPLSLGELLNFAWNSFRTGAKVELASAQSYTLLHYLAYADDQAYRKALGEYLVSAFRGKGAKTHLLKALGRKEKDVEADWLAYARTMAGG